ncbi:hypothetical protein ACFVHB_26915 [Kitasatospora sp. NPDC127111]|uniref:hypothetical protein n=1 Tax=Kitasatospora sp. NPDC127111 TaxID=3345363 RepID=UPI0036427AC2
MANQANPWASEQMPASIKWAVAGVWLHAVLNGIGALVLFGIATDPYGSDAGLLRLLAALSLLIAVLLAVCAALAPRRAGWTRATVLVIEWLGIISGLLLLFTGAVASLAGLAVSVLIVGAYTSNAGRSWFDR